MTRVNHALDLMTRQGTLSGLVGAYLYAALLVAGPWIFTVLGLVSLTAAPCEGDCAGLTVFRSVVIYNSMYALVVTSPIAFATGRYASERVQAGREANVSFGVVASLGLYAAVTLAVVAPFYAFATTLGPGAVVSSVDNAMLIGCSWLLIPFLGAIRAHNAVLGAFALGAAAMLALGAVLGDPPADTLLAAFNGSFALIDLVLLAAVARRFGVRIGVDPELTRSVPRRWELPAAGAAYALGLWIDKIIMWRSDAAGGLKVAGALQTMPSYDSAMFWAQLSSIPIIAVFFVHVETRFATLLRAYYRRIQERASLRELNERVHDIGKHVIASMFGLFGALLVVATIMIMASFLFMNSLGLKPSYLGIFRVSICAAAFYTSAMFCFTFLLHLDLRQPALLIVWTFLVFNGLLTAAFLPLGPALYGYGNMIAATLSLLVGFVLVIRELSWLHYHAFITNNSSV